MVRIEQNIEVWKNKLLDLGGRNRMLNYKDTKRSNLQIAKPKLFDLWDSFVSNEKPLVFPYIDDEDSIHDESNIALLRNC